MANSEWTDVPAASNSEWKDSEWADVAPTDQPSYNVDLKSKKALAKNQLEMLKRNPDFQKMSSLEKARLLGDTGVDLENPVDWREIPRFAGEAVMMPVNSLKKVATDVGTIGRAAMGLLPGRDFDTDLRAAADIQENYRPWETGMEPSRTGKVIGEVFQSGEEGLGKAIGPKLAKQTMGVVTNTLGLIPVAKGVMRRTAAVDPTQSPKSGWGEGFTENAPIENLPAMAIGAYDKISPTTNPLKVGTASAGTLEKGKQAVYNARSPQVLDNLFDTNNAKLAKPAKNMSDPLVSADYIAKSRTAVDEILQQADEGRLGTRNPDGTRTPINIDEGGVATGIEAAKNAKRNIWDEEIAPLLANAEAAGAMIDTNPIADFYAHRAKTAGGRFPEVAKEAARLEQFYRGKRMTPSEAQAQIAEFNTRINYDQLPAEQRTIAKNQIQEAAILRELTDNAIDTGLDNLGFKELKQRYGALSQHEATLSEAIMGELRKQNKGAWTSLDTIASGELIVGAMKMNPALIKAALATEALSQLKKRAKSPDVALQRMYRARRARGVEPREVYSQPEAQTMPQDLMAPDQFAVGKQIPARFQGAEGTVPTDPTPPQPFGTQGPTAPLQGGAVEPVPMQSGAPSLKDLLEPPANEAKAAIRKLGTTEVKKMLKGTGVGLTALVAYLMADDEKRAKMQSLPLFKNLPL